MKTAIIVHGMPSEEEYLDVTFPSPSNSHWLPWIQKQLVIKGVLAQSIELPKPYEPVYEMWKLVFGQLHIDEETMLIGHSCGAGFLLRWLSENKIKVGKVALIAPWLDPGHTLATGFFDFEIDMNLPGRVDTINVFYSIDDEKDIITSVDALKDALPHALYTEFSNKGHFTLGDMRTEEFPELVGWLTK